MKKFKRALITGASKGLGAEIVFQLQGRCENLVLLARDTEALNKLKTDLQTRGFRGEIDILTVDLTDSHGIEKIKQFTKEIDLVINNAGIGFVNEFSMMSEEQLKQMLMVNDYSLTLITHFYARKMAAAGGGQIINIASAAAFLPIPFFSVYSATKSYVLSFSQAVDIELRAHGVRVKALCTGGIKTSFHLTAGLTDQVAKENEKFMASPQEVAKAMIHLLDSDKSIYTPYVYNKAVSWMSRVFSRPVLAKMAGQSYRKFLDIK